MLKNSQLEMKIFRTKVNLTRADERFLMTCFFGTGVGTDAAGADGSILTFGSFSS